MELRHLLTVGVALLLLHPVAFAQARNSVFESATTQPSPSTKHTEAASHKWRHDFPFAKFTPLKSPQRRSDQIGDSPGAIIRVGQTSRKTVLEKLGDPSYSTENNRAFGYLFMVKVGIVKGLLFGPCSNPIWGTSDVWDWDDVWLEFDQNGILKRVEKGLVEKDKRDEDAAWRQFTKNVPDTIRPEQMDRWKKPTGRKGSMETAMAF